MAEQTPDKSNGNGNNKFLTWKTLAIALASVAFFFFSMWINAGQGELKEVKAELKGVRENKVDLARYCQDIADIKTMIGEVKASVVRIENLHIGKSVAKSPNPVSR